MNVVVGTLRRMGGGALQFLARSNQLSEVVANRRSRSDIFSKIYATQGWGSSESGSGTGSELRATENIRERLPQILEQLGARTLLDAPCGDWNFMQHVRLPVDHYIGADIVPQVIAANRERHGAENRTFMAADLTRDPLPSADVIMCRDCLIHLSFQDAASVLENFRRTGARWLLLSNYPEVTANHNQFTGRWWRRLNMRLAPFNFPEPVLAVADGGDVDPSQLTLWDLQALPVIRL